MPSQDKAVLMNKIEETLKPRMFANLLEEATEEINNTLDDFNVEIIQKDESVNTDDCLNAYVSAKTAEGKSEKTITRYRYLIERFLKAENVTAKEVTAFHIRDYFEHEMNRGICNNTIKGIREVLSSFYGWLFQERMIKFNPVTNIAPIKVHKKVKPSYSSMDIERMRMAGLNKRDAALINFMLSTACRISEVVGLNRSDVDLQNGEVKVLGKGNKERKAYLDEISIVLLREYLASRSDDNPAVFVNRFGKRIQPGGVRAMLCKVSKKTGVDKIHPHRFRRTQITMLLNRGMPIQNVAIMVGHSKIDTTMKYYYASEANIKADFKKYSV